MKLLHLHLTDSFGNPRTREDRSKMRSKTFEGIANAMAEQWGNL